MELNKFLQSLPELEDEKTVTIALSGGLDSTTLIYALVAKYGNERVKALSFDFGQRHDIELEMAKKTSSFLKIEQNIYKLNYLKDLAKDVSALIGGSDLKPKTAEENAGDPQINTYVPFRNLQFASITAAYAEAKNSQYIFQGLNATDTYGYWDTSLEFVERVNAVLALNRQNQIQFVAPFVDFYKDDELKLAKELSKKYGFDILKNTWSCYNGDLGNGKECGKCNTCSEKLTGYIQAGYSDEDILNKFDITQEELDEKIKDL